MKAEVDAKEFSEVIKWVVKDMDFTSQRDSLILTLFENGTGQLTHHGSNSYSNCEFSVMALKDAEGDSEMSLDGGMMNHIADALSRSQSNLTLSKKPSDTKLTISGDKTKFKVDLSTVPKIKKIEFVEIGDVSPQEFFSSMSRLSKLCEVENSAEIPSLGSVDLFFKKEDDELILSSHNYYCLAEKKISFTPSEGFPEDLDTTHLLVPARKASLSMGKIEDEFATLLYEESTGRLGYQAGWKTVLFPLNDGENQPYEDMISNVFDQSDKSVLISKKELSDAIRVVGTMSAIAGITTWKASKNGILVEDDFSDNRIVVEIEESDFEDEEDTNLSFQVMNEIVSKPLAMIPTKDLFVTWGSSSMPVTLRPVDVYGKPDKNEFVIFSTYSD